MANHGDEKVKSMLGKGDTCAKVQRPVEMWGMKHFRDCDTLGSTAGVELGRCKQESGRIYMPTIFILRIYQRMLSREFKHGNILIFIKFS